MPSNRAILHNRIETRVQDMINAGLFKEVKFLLQKYPELSINMPSMRSVGYRQTLEYFNGDIEEKDCIDKIIFATRQLAKRQMTWMRSMENLNLFDCVKEDLSREVITLIKNKIA